MRQNFFVAACVATAVLGSCGGSPERSERRSEPGDAAAFLAEAEADLLATSTRTSRAEWVQATYITQDTEAIAAAAREELIGLKVDQAKRAGEYDQEAVAAADPVAARKLHLLETAIPLPAPAEQEKQAELARITSRMESLYGSGRYCPEGRSEDDCLELPDLERVIDESRDPAALLEAWRGWHSIAPPMRDDFGRYVELANEGARELGFADLGAMWRSGYDMTPEAFAAEVDRLWSQVRPLYEALHCHVRARLAERYGDQLVDPSAPIPAHLLGNMWAQSWANVFDLVAPPAGARGYDLTQLLQRRGVDAVEMVRIGERFFTSLGFEPMPDTFWERSLFTKPSDRDVVCHASAWQVDLDEDLRIKMCIEVNAEDFSTIHHELGHNFYQAAYRHQDVLFRDSAHDGFHEALGDTVALSVTPAYLVQIGLLDREPPADADLALLLRMALDKVAFLPFGLLVDQWRWKVFAGEVAPESYNAAWWELRESIQGVRSPLPRSEADFDPGAKYHVPANVSYTRYFLAHILQFQLHRDLCRAIGWEGPLHRCSIYGNAEAGRRLREMMTMGLSRPWPEALEAVSSSREMDASAILDYFAPLSQWLEEQNEGRTCGWRGSTGEALTSG
jgi:peptidyl-dipeptidase A